MAEKRKNPEFEARFCCKTHTLAINHQNSVSRCFLVAHEGRRTRVLKSSSNEKPLYREM